MVVLAPEDLVEVLGLREEALDCSGLKLTLGEVYTFDGRGAIYRREKQLPQHGKLEPSKKGVYYLPQGSYLVRYNEHVRVPEDCIALAFPRSSLLRMGATLHTAVWDAGYEGRGIGLLVVFNPYGILLEEGAQIGQLVFLKLSRRTGKLYRGTYYKEN